MAGHSGRYKLAFVLAGIYILLAVLFSALGAILWAVMKGEEREALTAILMPRIGLSVLFILMTWAVLGMIVHAIYRSYVLAPLALREQALVMVNANPGLRLQEIGAPEIRTLAQVVNALADQRESLQRDVENRIREARSSVEEERNRLAALMSELTQSVVVCNLEGRILLYNNRARLQFKALSESDAAANAGLIGLGRSIFAVLERGLISHALENIQQRMARGSLQPVANFVTTSRAGQLIRVQMAPVLGASREEGEVGRSDSAIAGYILMLDNVTRNFEIEGQRNDLLQSLTEGSRASLGNVRAAVESLLEYPDMESAQRDRFFGIIRDEVSAMGQRLDRTVTEFSEALKTRWPLEEMLGEDLVEAVRRRIENKLNLNTKLESMAAGLWVKVDSFTLVQGLTYLASRLKDEYAIREIRFRLEPAGRLAHIDMVWSGAVMSSQTLLAWEIEPMSAAGVSSPLSLREVIERHGGEIWFEREKASHKSFIRLLVPAAVPKETDIAMLRHAESRPEYYDFDLFQQSEESLALDDRMLTDLTYTVFDTETTGLEPSAGDEIIQIGATRIVNGRLLRSESIDQLVDPRRPLRPEGIPIHGITEEMLVGQPTIDQVLPSFFAFCDDTVLVAHNAAFDMRFLQLKEDLTGIRFRKPVLDTLLLSAVIHPNQESHKLEAICERLGISVIGRHTALGDAIVTGEVFLKMIPLLAEMGIRTLREAREASERTYYARVKY